MELFLKRLKRRYAITANLHPITIKWLRQFFGEDKTAKKHIPPSIIEDLKPYTLKKATKLYRGLGWDDIYDYNLTPTFPVKAGDMINYTDSSYSSWTPIPRAAWGYASNFDAIRLVLECEIKPQDTLVDTDLVPKEVLDTCERKRGEHAESREIIVTKGKYKAKIIYVGFFDNEGEWQETEVPPIITP